MGGFQGYERFQNVYEIQLMGSAIFGWISYHWKVNVIEIHTPTVQYISHKWIKWVWFSNHKGYHIPHINGWLQYDFPTTGVQYISHKRRMWIWFPTMEVQNISHIWLNQGMIFQPHGFYSGMFWLFLLKLGLIVLKKTVFLIWTLSYKI